MLRLENINKAQDGETYLESISYNFESGKLYTILGRTGSGKTSLLRALIGLLPLDEGKIFLDSRDITKIPIWKRDMAMVYQQFINYPHLNVLNNVAFPLLRKGMTRRTANAKAHNVLTLLGMERMEKRKPAELSGGQQQRVALARSLVKETKILMMDEPLVNLDYKLREQLREQFPQILESNHQSVILYATTEPREAMQLGDEILIMHEGRIVDSGQPDALFNTPKNITVAKLIGDPPISIFPAHMAEKQIELVGGISIDGAGLALPGNGQYLLGVRAEKVHLGGKFHAQVALSEITGSETVVHLRLPFGNMIMLLEGVVGFEPDEEINVGFVARDLFFFDIAGNLLLSPKNSEKLT